MDEIKHTLQDRMDSQVGNEITVVKSGGVLSDSQKEEIRRLLDEGKEFSITKDGIRVHDENTKKGA